MRKLKNMKTAIVLGFLLFGSVFGEVLYDPSGSYVKVLKPSERGCFLVKNGTEAEVIGGPYSLEEVGLFLEMKEKAFYLVRITEGACKGVTGFVHERFLRKN